MGLQVLCDSDGENQWKEWNVVGGTVAFIFAKLSCPICPSSSLALETGGHLCMDEAPSTAYDPCFIIHE